VISMHFGGDGTHTSQKARCVGHPAYVAIGNDKKVPAQLGEVFDKILANQKIYNQGGKPMGPGNQGGNIVNGVMLTPKASVPH